METILKNRCDAVELFLRTIRPLKPFYSKHHAFLHVGNTGKDGRICQNYVGTWPVVVCR